MKNISLKQIECFLEVCRDFHFTRAAARLGLAQPPLSRHIRELENKLGLKLFERSGKSVTLSLAGHAFLEEIYPLPSLLNRAIDAARRARTGEVAILRIGFVGAILGESLLDTFHRYRNQHPDTRLQLLDMKPSELIEQLESGNLDGAFLGVKPSRLSSKLRCCPWRREKLLVCLHQEHPLAQRERLKLKDIALENFISLSAAVAPSYRDLLDRLFQRKGYRPAIAQETNAVPALLSMVVAGCGIALLPPSATTPAGGRLATLPLDERDAKIQEVFLYQKNPSPPLKRFLAELQNVS